MNMDGGAGSGGAGRTCCTREGNEVRCSGTVTFQGSPGKFSKPTTSSPLPSLTALLANDSLGQDVRRDDEAASSPPEPKRSNNDNTHGPRTPPTRRLTDWVNPRAPCCKAHPRHLQTGSHRGIVDERIPRSTAIYVPASTFFELSRFGQLQTKFLSDDKCCRACDGTSFALDRI